MINKQEYAFEDIRVNILGRELEGIRGVEYGANKEHFNIHGRGNKPVSMGKGKKDAEPGTLTILQSEFEAIQSALPRGKDPTDIDPFPMVISYAPEGGVVVTDIVPNCRVNRYKKGMSTEDGFMTIVLELTTGIPQLNV